MHTLTQEELAFLRKGTLVYHYPLEENPAPFFHLKSENQYIEYEVVHISLSAPTTYTFVARGPKSILQLQTTRAGLQLLNGYWAKEDTPIMRKVRKLDLLKLERNVICFFPNDGSGEASLFDPFDFTRHTYFTVRLIDKNKLRVHINDILSSLDEASSTVTEEEIDIGDVTNGYWWTSLP